MARLDASALENIAAQADFYQQTMGRKITKVEVIAGEIILWAETAELLNVLKHLKDTASCRFSQLIDITAIDYPAKAERFEVAYQLLSLHQNMRVRVKVLATEETLLPSVVDIFRSAHWLEREVWDMFGIRFSGNPDLRRILTDYGFEGHPLRKDFPLTGYVEVRYDAERKQVVYEPVQLQQDFRSFDFLSPWEGAKYIMPKNTGSAS